MCALIPIGFHSGPRFGLSPFAGAVIGVASADLLRYATSVIGVRRLGLKVFLKDMMLTCAVGATALVATLAGRWVQSTNGSAIAHFFTSALVVASIWAPIAWGYFHRKELARASAAARRADPRECVA